MRQRIELTGTNRSIGLIALMVHVRGPQPKDHLICLPLANDVMVGLEPTISGERFSGLRFASPENDESGRPRSAPPEAGRRLSWAQVLEEVRAFSVGLGSAFAVSRRSRMQ